MGRRRLRIEDAGVAWRLPHSKSIWTRNEKKNKCYKYSNISSSSSSWTRGNVALLPAGEWLQAKGKKNNKSNIQSINIVDPLLRFFASRTDAKLFVFCLFLYIFWLNETLFYITDVVSATTRHLLPLSLSSPSSSFSLSSSALPFFSFYIYICSSPDSPGQHRVPLPRSIKRQSEPRWVKI